MPNFYTHLAVAKRYAEKNNITGDDARDFFDGSFYPDMEDKNGKSKTEAHYNKTEPIKVDADNFLRDRIDYKEFFAKNKIDTLFKKGELLHLIVDNECYPAILDMKRFYDIYKSGVRPRQVVTETMGFIDEYLSEKYRLETVMPLVSSEVIEQYAKFSKVNVYGEVPKYNLLDTPEAVAKLDEFIEEISSIDLDEFVRKHGIKI